MRQSAATLESFYLSRLGQATADRLSQRLIDLWGGCEGQRVLTIGFPPPLLPLWQDLARTCVGVVPETVGNVRYENQRGGAIAVSPEQRLPFGDGVFDRVILLHALEEADNPRLILREAWRVLAPEGRIVVATANRRSFWSLDEGNAFGHGRPWTRKQLIQFMADSLFQVTASTTAVHMPPLNWSIITAASRSWERVGEMLTPGLGGVVLVEAVKRLYAKPGGSAAAAVTDARQASKGRAALPRNKAAPGVRTGSAKSPIDVAATTDTP